MSLKDQIRKADDIEVETIDVDEWGVKVKIRGMTAGQRSQFIQDTANLEKGTVDLAKMYPDLVILTCYDPESDEPVFTQKDRDLVNSKAGKAIERIARKAMELSGLTEDAMDEAGKESIVKKGGSSTN